MSHTRTEPLSPPSLTQRPALLLVGLAGVALLLLGGVPLAERFLAHVAVWGAAVSVPGLPHLVLVVAGAGLCALFARRRPGAADPAAHHH
ncbi:hypothetical protein [Actinacidiphila sp. bgisy167]|uniref:hypothetical protein n=1 Tax=Actinacidiphila sp. bgisy167 TaxID=3413797 RepID=UPI003D75B50D